MPGPRKEATVTDRRLIRIAWLPAALALITVMFSLDGIPDPVEPLSPTGIFEGDEAVSAAREIVRKAPDREAGSSGDLAAARLVAERFREVPAGAVAEQVFEADDAEARNVLLTLPGDPERTILVLAPRDAERGSGAATTAASTGVLVELARTLGVAGHESTYLLGSTSGGAAGVRALLDGVPEPQTVEAVITLSALGVASPEPPFALITTRDATSGPLQLRRTAERAIETQVGRAPEGQSGFVELARLAFPSGLGPQATAIAEGFDAVGISAAAERPPIPSADEPEDLSPATVQSFGRAAHALVGAVDLAGGLEHGPSAYIEVGGNVVPGWTLALLALSLLVPALAASIDGCARVARRAGELGRGLAWALARALPFVGGLAALYGLALVGLIPRPEFPFDPGLHPTGARALIAFALIAVAVLASAYALRRFGVRGRRAPTGALAPVGLVASVAGLALWFANPYLALLVAPAAHVWLLADAPQTRARAAGVSLGVFAALLPAALALVSLTDALDLGADAPWTLTLMAADGQLGLAVLLPSAFAAGALAATAALALGGGGLLPAHPVARRPFEPDARAEDG